MQTLAHKRIGQYAAFYSMGSSLGVQALQSYSCREAWPPLPAFISQTPLPSPLVVLHLWGNILTGFADLNLPSGLRELYLTSNQLTGYRGRFPSTLEELGLNLNSLHGSLSADSFSLPPSLTTLRLDGNSLTGLLPAWTSFPSGFVRLGLSGNAFSGSIPPEWSSIPDGISIELMNNRLTGAEGLLCNVDLLILSGAESG